MSFTILKKNTVPDPVPVQSETWNLNVQPSTNPQPSSQLKLVAKWVVIDGKLICKWLQV
jgi:hypothetical protein